MKKDYTYTSYVKITTTKFKPFLNVGTYKIIDWYNGEPVIIGSDGHKLRLDNKKDYQIIDKLK